MAKKLKFLFISAPFSGIEIFQRNLHQVISQRSDIDSVWEWVEVKPKGFLMNLLPLSLNWTLKAGIIAKQKINELEKKGEVFDAFFINHLTPLTFIRKFRRRVPTIMSLDITPPLLSHYSYWYQYKKSKKILLFEKLKYFITRQAYRDAAFLLPWSEWVGQSLIRDYGIVPEKIEVIPAGINLLQWSRNGSGEKNQNGPVRILFVGGEFLRKGGDILFNTARRDEFRDCEFHFVTRDFKGVPEKNTFFYSSMEANSEALRTLYCTADIFVLPTRADFSPNAVCEAMAYELPVITTMVGSLTETVIDGENGFFIPLDDEDALADKLRLLITDKELRIRMGKAGKQYVEEKFNLEKNAERIIYHLKRVARADKEKRG